MIIRLLWQQVSILPLVYLMEAGKWVNKKKEPHYNGLKTGSEHPRKLQLIF